METGDWVQVVIAAIYVAILVVMILQRRDMQASAESAEARANEAMKHAEASAAAMRELAERHGRLADQAEASATAASAAADQAERTHEHVIRVYEEEQERRNAARRTVAVRLHQELAGQEAVLLEWRARWMNSLTIFDADVERAMGELRQDLHRAIRYAASVVEQIDVYDSDRLGAELTRSMRKLPAELNRLGMLFVTERVTAGAGQSWIESASKALHDVVVEFERLIDAEAEVRSWDDRAKEAWQRVATGAV